MTYLLRQARRSTWSGDADVTEERRLEVQIVVEDDDE